MKQTKPKKTNKFTIVPADRIDYCGACKAEHGYECPLDKPKKTKEIRAWAIVVRQDYNPQIDLEYIYPKKAEASKARRQLMFSNIFQVVPVSIKILKK